MRIVIASGIYPPEVGGPALYAEGVKLALEKAGHEAPLALFGPLRRYPSGIRHVLYTFQLVSLARGADAIFAFDTYSVGIPATLVAVLLRKKVVIRIGGDFVWEHYTRRTNHLIPIPDFYSYDRDLNLKERTARMLVGWMLRHATLAFNSRWLLLILQQGYGFDMSRAHVVENVIGERLPSMGDDRTLIMYGREVKLKRAGVFRRAFASARSGGVGLSFEEGTVTHDAFIRRLRSARAFVNPDFSDFAPNAVIDAIRCGKPFLLTKYCGYAERFGDLGVIVDPANEDDVRRGIERLADDATYRQLCERIAAFKEVRTYDDVAAEMVELSEV